MPKTRKTQRCQTYVTDKINKRKRLCKNKSHLSNHCSIHSNNENNDLLFENKCCYCGIPCKMESQSCGSCARTASLYGLNYLYSTYGLISEFGI